MQNNKLSIHPVYWVCVPTLVVVFWMTQVKPALREVDPVVIHDTIYVERDNPFNEDTLVAYIKSLNLKYPEVIVAQARLETGNYTSTIFQENNNLFGMKCAAQRPYTHKGSRRGHAKYDSWQESVLDYAMFQSSFLRKKSKEEYVREH